MWRLVDRITNVAYALSAPCRMFFALCNYLNIHVPLHCLALLVFVLYQVIFIIPLAFVYTPLEQLFKGTFMYALGVGIMSSMLQLLLLPYPEPPPEIRVPNLFYKMSPNEQARWLKMRVQKFGANYAHTDQVCHTCGIIRTERVHHCPICDVCTPRMDHHCFVLNRCVHYGNQKMFALLLFYVALFSGAFFAVNWRAMQHYGWLVSGDRDEPSLLIQLSAWLLLSAGLSSSTHVLALTIVVIFVAAMWMFLSTALIAFLYYAVYRSRSIMSCNKASTISTKFPFVHVGDPRDGCFQLPGVMANFEVIFGPLSVMWLLPVKTNRGGGWTQTCSCTVDPDLLKPVRINRGHVGDWDEDEDEDE